MLWRLISQTIYDLIGRIVPAAVVLSLVFVVLQLPTLRELPGTISWLKESTNTATGMLGVLAAYTVGVVMGQIYSVTLGKLFSGRDKTIENECLQKCLLEHNCTLEALGRKPLHIDLVHLPRTFVMHDHLRLVAPTEIPRLLKVRAERRMSEVIMLGAVVLSVFNAVFLVTQFSSYRLILEVILALTALGAWRSADRRLKNFTNGTMIMWLMHATGGPFPLPQGSRSDDKSSEATA
ncbi:MAG: hypothetical protein MN733_43810 [Nitrososphaera sp.]|nr:hypothetical protein [Nitrososphaera sp.]